MSLIADESHGGEHICSRVSSQWVCIAVKTRKLGVIRLFYSPWRNHVALVVFIDVMLHECQLLCC